MVLCLTTLVHGKTLMATSLVIQSGKHKGRKIKFPPEGVLLIGRDAECHLRLESTDVSRRHCELHLTEAGILVKDLNSRNGTFVDGYLIEETSPLKPGSILRVGPMEFAIPGQRPEPSKPAVKKVDDTSDDDIAAWLTEEGETEDPNLEDSTIIPGALNAKEIAEESIDLKDYSRHPDAQEAAEIIQKHWQEKNS